jgi:aspartyl aminopeptidase
MDKRVEHKPDSAWERYRDDEAQRAVADLAESYLEFLSRCKTERETVQRIQRMLESNGIPEDDLSADVFYRISKGKTILMVRKGRRPLSEGVRILGAHADTPRLDIKQHPLYESCDVALAKTHYYGGIRKHQWLARPLALHGVVVTTEGSTVEVEIGEKSSDPVFVIADLLPHLASKQNEEKLAKAFEGEKMNVLLGNQPLLDETEEETGDKPAGSGSRVKQRILELLYDRYGLTEEDLFSAELQAVPAGPARSVGLDGSLIGGYGQDDRISVFCALQAFLSQHEPEFTQVVIFWDKEEIGSEGATSARSLFLEYAIQDVLRAWEPETPLSTLFQRSKAISADVHGAIDPDYQDLHDSLNASKLGYGPVFCKFTGHRGKIGASEATAEYVAWLRNLLNEASIPWQMAEIGKVDAGGGGTVAKHLAVYGLDIIDFGPSVLGMHSPFEVTSKVDVYATYLAYCLFLDS